MRRTLLSVFALASLFVGSAQADTITTMTPSGWRLVTREPLKFYQNGTFQRITYPVTVERGVLGGSMSNLSRLSGTGVLDLKRYVNQVFISATLDARPAQTNIFFPTLPPLPPIQYIMIGKITRTGPNSWSLVILNEKKL